MLKLSAMGKAFLAAQQIKRNPDGSVITTKLRIPINQLIFTYYDGEGNIINGKNTGVGSGRFMVESINNDFDPLLVARVNIDLDYNSNETTILATVECYQSEY